MAKFIEIKFTKQTQYLGRNGVGKMHGAEVSVMQNGTVALTPLNSRGIIGASRLEVPKEDIPKLIDALLAVTAD